MPDPGIANNRSLFTFEFPVNFPPGIGFFPPNLSCHVHQGILCPCLLWDDRKLALQELHFGESSLDLRLGYTICRMKDPGDGKIVIGDDIDSPGDLWMDHELGTKRPGGPDTSLIETGEYVQAMTRERFEIPNDLAGLVKGRSSIARPGLSVTPVRTLAATRLARTNRTGIFSTVANVWLDWFREKPDPGR